MPRPSSRPRAEPGGRFRPSVRWGLALRSIPPLRSDTLEDIEDRSLPSRPQGKVAPRRWSLPRIPLRSQRQHTIPNPTPQWRPGNPPVHNPRPAYRRFLLGATPSPARSRRRHSRRTSHPSSRSARRIPSGNVHHKEERKSLRCASLRRRVPGSHRLGQSRRPSRSSQRTRRRNGDCRRSSPPLPNKSRSSPGYIHHPPTPGRSPSIDCSFAIRSERPAGRRHRPPAEENTHRRSHRKRARVGIRKTDNPACHSLHTPPADRRRMRILRRHKWEHIARPHLAKARKNHRDTAYRPRTERCKSVRVPPRA